MKAETSGWLLSMVRASPKCFAYMSIMVVGAVFDGAGAMGGACHFWGIVRVVSSF